MYITPEQHKNIEDLCVQGYIRSAHSESYPNLTIYNYTPKAQFEHYWNEYTRMCRGLVVDDKNRIVIKCPPKFFNDNEPEAPKYKQWESVIFSEKLDGYYISFRYDHEYGLIVTSRGSFNNQYTQAARKLLPKLDFIQRDTDYFCELCQTFPGDEQLIVAKYTTPSLVLWGINDSVPPANLNWHIKTAQYFSEQSALDYLKKEVEGVVAFCPQTKERVKMKTNWYLEMHRAISNLSLKDTIDALISGNRLSQQLDLPQEHIRKIQQWEEKALNLYDIIQNEAGRINDMLMKWSKKEIALYDGIGDFIKPVIFAIRDGKNYDAVIWRIVKKDLLRDSADQ